MKIVGKNYYVHKSAYEDLIPIVKDPVKYRGLLFSHNNYEVIKYDKGMNKLSLIESPDWDTSNEPLSLDAVIIDLDTMQEKTYTASKLNPQIYHSKELFVHEDYDGFDVSKARQRTEEWNSIPSLNKSLIGRKKYWTKLLTENGMEI